MRMHSTLMSAIGIGLAAGLIFGILVGNPLLGILLGGLLGFKGGTLFKNNRGIPVRPNRKHLTIFLSITGVLFIILFWFFRPWIHDIIIAFYIVPVITLFFLLSAGLSAALFYRKREVAMIIGGVMAVCFLLLMFNDVLMQKSIVNTEEYNKISTLPDSRNTRLLPMAIANRYLEDSLQKSREKVGPLDLIILNGTLAWTSPRIPDGGILYLTEEVQGILVADATNTDRDTRIITQTMKVGEGIGITDNIEWVIYKEDYWMNIDDIYYIENSGDIYTIASIIGYRFSFPVMVPYFKGVFIVDREGDTTWVDVKDVSKNQILQGNKIYPESLARLQVDSYKCVNGWINAVFLHKDQIEISDVYGQSNRQPFLMDTSEGLKWIVATEPYGESYGVFKIFLVDAFSGKIDLLELDEDQTLTGPVRVVSYVKKQFPMIDWATSRVVEPRPYIVDGNLFWMLSITPSDFAGVSYTVLVDAATNEVIPFQDDDKLNAYLLGEEPVIEDDEEGSQEDYIEDKTREIIIEKIDDIESELAELRKLLAES